MYRREREFNDKVLALRDRKMDVIKAISKLHQEYYQIHDLLRVSVVQPLNVQVQMHPDEFPETYVNVCLQSVAM